MDSYVTEGVDMEIKTSIAGIFKYTFGMRNVAGSITTLHGAADGNGTNVLVEEDCLETFGDFASVLKRDKKIIVGDADNLEKAALNFDDTDNTLGSVIKGAVK
ncbi:MAG: hypothetical protein VB031_05700 [Eubacteriaceae bacterium]|nr:hypothetical protein [Eubacteriaceae bacterium]